jgi:hypothetical protein
VTTLHEWESFYVIVGSSAGALIGLQFVVMTLIATMPITRSDVQAGTVFTTPSVVHFGIVLLLSAISSAPWKNVNALLIAWGVVGLGGVVYLVRVAQRLRSQKACHAVFEDWAFHVLRPLFSYALLVVATVLALWKVELGLFVVAGSALLLLVRDLAVPSN